MHFPFLLRRESMKSETEEIYGRNAIMGFEKYSVQGLRLEIHLEKMFNGFQSYRQGIESWNNPPWINSSALSLSEILHSF